MHTVVFDITRQVPGTSAESKVCSVPEALERVLQMLRVQMAST